MSQNCFYFKQFIYWVFSFLHILLSIDDWVSFVLFCAFQCDPKDMREHYMQTERFKVTSLPHAIILHNIIMLFYITCFLHCVECFFLCFLVSDGCDQSLSSGYPVLLHRCQFSVAVSSSSKGEISHKHTLLIRTQTNSIIKCKLYAFLQYHAFFEFNDRLEAVMSKAYIYR